MKRLRAALGFVLAALFLYLALHNVEWPLVMTALGQANYLLVLPAACVTMSGYLVRAYRWSRIIRPVLPVPFMRLYPILVVGFAANNVLPARMGELVRAYGASEKVGLGKTLALSTIVVERVFDGLSLLLFLGLVMLLFPAGVGAAEVQAVAWFSAVFFLSVAAALLVLLRWPALAERTLSVGLKALPSRFARPAWRMLESFLTGLRVLGNPRDMAVVALCSLSIWCIEGLSYYLVMQAFSLPLNAQDGMLAALFVLVFVNLGIMLPSAPGYIGTFQFFAKMALGAFGIPGAISLAYALVSHAMQYVLVTSLAASFFFVRHNLSLRIPEDDKKDDPSSVVQA